MALARGAGKLLTHASAEFPDELQEAAGARDQGLAGAAAGGSVRPAHRPGPGAAIRCNGQTTTMRGDASGRQFAPIWSRFLASGSLTVHRLDSAGCTDLTAVLRRYGHAARNIGRQALQRTRGPAGRFRPKPHGSVAGPTPTSLAAPAEARQRRPAPFLHRSSNLASLEACGRDIDVMEVKERPAGPPYASVLGIATPLPFRFACLCRWLASRPSGCQRRHLRGLRAKTSHTRWRDARRTRMA